MRLLVTLLLVVSSSCGGQTAAGDGGADAEADAAEGRGCVYDQFIDFVTPVHYDLPGCGVCVGIHERAVSPFGPSFGRTPIAIAVPDGLLLGLFHSTHLAMTFVSLRGEVASMAGLFDAEDGRPFGYTVGEMSLHPVPESNLVWVAVRSSPDPLVLPEERSLRTDLILLEYTAGGVRRVAEGVVGLVDTGAVLLNGDFLASVRPVRGLGTELVRVRPQGDAVDILRVDQATAGVEPQTEQMWRVGDNVAVTSIGPRDAGGFPRVGAPHVSLLTVLDEDLVPVGPPSVVGAETGDGVGGEYELGEAPTLVRSIVLADGSAFLLSSGALSGTDSAFWAHHWGSWVDSSGILEQSNPGILLNRDNFLRASSSASPNQSVRPAPGGVVVIWADDAAPGFRTQLVRRDGSLTFRPPQAGHVASGTLSWTQDGTGATYLVDTTDPANPGAVRLGPALERLWDGLVRPASCADALPGGVLHSTIGAHGAGVWVLFEEITPDVTGVAVGVGKVALLTQDGNFAW